MIQGLPKLGAGLLSQTEPHDEFLELCAASTSGDLTDDEQKRLREHLAICASCREALRQYESIVSDVIPTIAAGEESEHVQSAEAWSPEQQGQAEKAFFDRLAKGEKHPPGETGIGMRHRVFPIASCRSQPSPAGGMSGCSMQRAFCFSARSASLLIAWAWVEELT